MPVTNKEIFNASLIHTLNITVYIFIITLVIGLVIGLIGEDTIETFIKNNVFLGPVISSLIGLVPNCAASVIITNLYIENVINMASLVSGLLTGAGVGLLVLFRTNKKHLKENLCVVGIMYLLSSVWISFTICCIVLYLKKAIKRESSSFYRFCLAVANV